MNPKNSVKDFPLPPGVETVPDLGKFVSYLPLCISLASAFLLILYASVVNSF